MAARGLAALACLLGASARVVQVVPRLQVVVPRLQVDLPNGSAIAESLRASVPAVVRRGAVLLPLLVKHRRTRNRKLQRMKELKESTANDFKLGKDYHISIVTTAALPWMTGTAVNPLLRAAYLAKAGKRVTLMVPWVDPVDQDVIFPDGVRFTHPTEQETWLRQWLRERDGKSDGSTFRIAFYPARYDTVRGSVMPLGDVTQFFAEDENDLCVLEEPEHLTWYHRGRNWRERFKLVVGVIHTNYKHYAETCRGPVYGRTVEALNFYMCQAYCDTVIKLSDSLQKFPRAVTTNVHGVRSDFLDIGRRAGWWRPSGDAYFLGKALWPKGHRKLLDYLKLERNEGDGARTQPPTHIDIFGDGEDLPAIKAEAEAEHLDVTFRGRADHASSQLHNYRVFVNPSESEVLSTTTAEALAMGKYVVLKRHPSNTFFEQFRNALFYETPREFLLQLRFALSTTPAALSDAERRELSWEGATDRFLEAVTAAVTVAEAQPPSVPDATVRLTHAAIQPPGRLGDAMRKISGAGPVAQQSWLASPAFRGERDVARITSASIARNPPPGYQRGETTKAPKIPKLQIAPKSKRS